MPDNSSLLQKIKKMLAIANDEGATEEEAKTAYLMAQKLLVKHGLTMQDVDSKPQKEQVFGKFAKAGQNQPFRFPLAKVVGDAFRCVPILHETRRIFFVGHAEDCEVCAEVFNSAYSFAYREGWKLQNANIESVSNDQSIVNSYGIGFVYGLQNAFAIQSKALMVVVPYDVKEAAAKLAESENQEAPKAGKDINAARAFAEGRHDGETYLNGKRLYNAQ